MKRFLIISISLFFIINTVHGQISVQDLLTENKINPIGLDAIQPRFSWKLVGDHRNIFQKAYEIKIKTGTGSIWNSGKVVSDKSVQVSYSGPSLQSGKRYQWQVRIWDNTDKVSSWSQTSYF
ncbi:MAG TPA: alpha-L-rhamnosidase, partial [Flavisolibacter sp.]|nr:alpha-L-rhamnosidase [Flavisolibacter sp.]